MTCQIPGTADFTAFSSFYSWKEKSTNLERPTGITYNQKIRRFRDFISLARKYSAVNCQKCHRLHHASLAPVAGRITSIYTGDVCCDFRGDFSCDFVVISNRPCNYWWFRGDLKKRWRKGESITSNSIHKTQQSVGIDQNAARVKPALYFAQKTLRKLWCSPNPPSLRKFSTIKPPSPSEFPSPFVGGMDIFWNYTLSFQYSVFFLSPGLRPWAES